MAWYEFSQNNTGGSFEVNDKVCHRVMIEAKTADDANRLASNLGIYFDGCDSDVDCSCCGDRWYRASGEGETYPMQYTSKLLFQTPEEHMQHLADDYGWTVPDARIYYSDGKRVSEITGKRQRAA